MFLLTFALGGVVRRGYRETLVVSFDTGWGTLNILLDHFRERNGLIYAILYILEHDMKMI